MTGNIPPEPACRTRELLDSVVDNVFGAGLSLQVATSLPGGAAGPHITDALRVLDDIVRDVRDHLFTEYGQKTGPAGARHPGLTPGSRASRQARRR